MVVVVGMVVFLMVMILKDVVVVVVMVVVVVVEVNNPTSKCLGLIQFFNISGKLCVEKWNSFVPLCVDAYMSEGQTHARATQRRGHAVAQAFSRRISIAMARF
jgi:hypothetical protein